MKTQNAAKRASPCKETPRPARDAPAWVAYLEESRISGVERYHLATNKHGFMHRPVLEDWCYSYYTAGVKSIGCEKHIHLCEF